MFGNYWLELEPEDYIIDVSQNGDMSVCMFLIAPNEYEFFIFGQPIFQSYYVVHSMDNATMGFVPSTQSKKGIVQKG